MKKLLITFLFILFTFTSNILWSDDFDKGFKAYNSGDFAAAVKWFTLAAEQGDADSQNILGVMYDEGEGVSQNIKAAMKWFKLAFEQGDADAQKTLEVYQDVDNILENDRGFFTKIIDLIKLGFKNIFS